MYLINDGDGELRLITKYLKYHNHQCNQSPEENNMNIIVIENMN